MRALSPLATLAILAGCTGQSLSAGSDDAGGLAPAQVTRTRAILPAMIDTLAMDAANLYFTAEDGSLYVLPKAGTSAPVILAAAATPGSVYTEGLTVDDDNLYWTALGDGVSTGVVLTVPKSGGSPVALAMGEARPFGIAVDATTVYWCDQGVPPPDQTDGIVQVAGSIRSVPKGGGARTILASDGDTPDALTLDEAGVIWHDARAILRVEKSGGAPTTLSSQAIPWATRNLVTAVDTLYFAANVSGWSLASVPIAGGATTTLAAIDAPGGIQVAGTSVFWDAQEGATVGAIESTSAGVLSPADPVPGSTGQQASLFLADATTFYWVEFWESPTLVVVLRIRAR